MRQQIERTGLGPQALISKLDSPPPDLNKPLVAAWLSGSLKTARKDILDFVMEQWRQQPDTNLIELTSEIVAEMQNEKTRTGTGASALLRGVRPSEHNGLSSGMLRQWLSGRALRADKAHIDFVIARWKALPDYDDEWLPLTKSMQEKIASLHSRIQMSWPRFFDEHTNIPEGLNYNLVWSFLTNQRKTIRKVHYNYLIETLTALGDQPDDDNPNCLEEGKKYRNFSRPKTRKGYIPLTPEMSKMLRAEHDRTGVTIKSFAYILATSGDGVKLKPSVLNQWMRGDYKSVPETLYNKVIATWRSLPDKNAFWDR